MNAQMILVMAVIAFAILFVMGLTKRCNSREGYRDPIYLNRSKYAFDIYPRANGSIYGFPYRYGGSWSIFSGYPYYDRAY